ncbi:microtubule-associated protein 70-5-like [Pyrus ussuriensis x Pyrus communis]|uniref:Microtubule-associated protein 70-5-like n=1 Tax=Pyrus ussuriensis x Pyrus communis TaxID=2448454 RepID=A0A5N5IBT1_9ROSA|nr:microtubule-associated protein 70-5-like [Pyrus ussuriensis x Pyrus communis]
MWIAHPFKNSRTDFLALSVAATAEVQLVLQALATLSLIMMKPDDDEGVITDDDDDLEEDFDGEMEEDAIMSLMMTMEDELAFPFKYKLSFSVCFKQLNLILSKLVHRDEDVNLKSSNKVEKPMHFVSYTAAIRVAAAAVTMPVGLVDTAGAYPDDDEGVLTDEDDGDDLEGDANNEMEEEEDDNGDDSNEGGVGVPAEIIGCGMHELVARIDLEQGPNAATFDQ